MTKRPFQKESHIRFKLNANENFVIFVTSKFITCFQLLGFQNQFHFIWNLTSGIKFQSIANFLRSEHIYWNLDLQSEVHSI